MPLPTPDTRVVELRVHGIVGPPPAELLDAVAAVEVGGDGLGRIVRPADRLLRPAPGAMLQVGGRATPHTVEGYQWSRMTSGGAAKAIWALLFPFSLANVAHWMLPPIPTGSRIAALLGGCLRALLRLAALLLTMLLVSQFEVVSLDLLAYRCLGGTASCLAVIPATLREQAALRTVVGLLPVLVVVYILHRVSVVNWRVNARVPAPEPPTARQSELPAANLVADPDTPALRALHLTGALAVAALLAAGGVTVHGSGFALGCRLAALTLTGCCLLYSLVLAGPNDSRHTGRRTRTVPGRTPRRLLLTLGVLVLLAAAVLRSVEPGRLPGSDSTVESLGGLFVLVAVLVAVLLVPAALIARREWAGLPPGLRPWAGGWMAAPTLVLAGVLGAGFGAGVAITVRRAIGPALPLPAGYDYLTLLWGVAGVLLLAAALVIIGTAALRRRLASAEIPDLLRLLHHDEPVNARTAAAASWWAEWERRHIHLAVITTAAVLAIGVAAAIVLRLRGIGVPGWAAPVTGLGVLVLGVLAVALLRAVYLAARHRDSARHLGSLSDLACFWPREAHPVVPPCYAAKVVPEVAARAAEHLRDPHTRVVLTGHSQGSLLVAVAAGRLLASLPTSATERLGMVSAGSPLQWAYLRAFPSVVPFASLDALNQGLGGRWRSLCRLTDPFGGAVSTWERQVYHGELLGVGFQPDGTPGPLSAATVGPTGALVLGGDHWIPDPQHGPVTGRRWTPGLRRHSDYSADPEWDRAVAMAAGLRTPDIPGDRQPSLFRLPSPAP